MLSYTYFNRYLIIRTNIYTILRYAIKSKKYNFIDLNEFSKYYILPISADDDNIFCIKNRKKYNLTYYTITNEKPKYFPLNTTILGYNKNYYYYAISYEKIISVNNCILYYEDNRIANYIISENQYYNLEATIVKLKWTHYLYINNILILYNEHTKEALTDKYYFPSIDLPAVYVNYMDKIALLCNHKFILIDIYENKFTISGYTDTVIFYKANKFININLFTQIKDTHAISVNMNIYDRFLYEGKKIWIVKYPKRDCIIPILFYLRDKKIKIDKYIILCIYKLLLYS